ncbi:hypothetical protein N7539_005873 [Penicillium diatomitis]|uniref:Mob1 family protein n=1 Tax=Penicillium diatomitis TaxID=2819901 RepID=A0A9W9X530_9EURO|nr:uncharacterized protein N7539_005873 [Penicillium diatomitis]KAJ5484077.1 hypothetical protein N7539_005873 [Penicillium diatomitis]
MAAAGVSPSSSPRLPSPPPFTEVQIGPQSPSVGEAFGKDADSIMGPCAGEDSGSTRRIRPGTKAADMAFGPPLVPLSQLDSPFQLQEHLKALYHHFTKPEGSDTMVPITRHVATQLATPPEGVDRSLWLYELCRFLTMKVNNLIIAFFAESPPCSAQTCPEMRASEWQYLCAVHDPPKSCCAIDYCCHTLDWATNTLTSPKYFPSRLTLGAEGSGGPQASMRHLTNIFRRLYRIFAHAWFQHREVFWTVEGHDGLYVFFKTVCDMYALIPEDNYTIPQEAEGPDAVQSSIDDVAPDNRRLTILRKSDEGFSSPNVEGLDPAIGTGATTRRHKHSPSMGSRVSTITESAEDNEDAPQLSRPLEEVVQEEAESESHEETNEDIGEPTESTAMAEDSRDSEDTQNTEELEESGPASPQTSVLPVEEEHATEEVAQEVDEKGSTALDSQDETPTPQDTQDTPVGESQEEAQEKSQDESDVKEDKEQ